MGGEGGENWSDFRYVLTLAEECLQKRGDKDDSCINYSLGVEREFVFSRIF